MEAQHTGGKALDSVEKCSVGRDETSSVAGIGMGGRALVIFVSSKPSLRAESSCATFDVSGEPQGPDGLECITGAEDGARCCALGPASSA